MTPPEAAPKREDVTQAMHEDPAFVAAWSKMEAEGYIYGDDALEQVYLGWKLAHAARPDAGDEVEQLRAALKPFARVLDASIPENEAAPSIDDFRRAYAIINGGGRDEGNQSVTRRNLPQMGGGGTDRKSVNPTGNKIVEQAAFQELRKAWFDGRETLRGQPYDSEAVELVWTAQVAKITAAMREGQKVGNRNHSDAGDEVEPVATPWITRKVRKGTDEHRAYLRARFPVNGGAPSPFNFDGHNWRYYVTSFDDIGEYDVIQRPPEALAAMREGVDRGMVERFSVVRMLRADSKTIRQNANQYVEESPADARALHEVATTLLFKARQIERGDHNPSAPITAQNLTDLIRGWLDADDATHWGAFEKALDAVVSPEARKIPQCRACGKPSAYSDPCVECINLNTQCAAVRELCAGTLDNLADAEDRALQHHDEPSDRARCAVIAAEFRRAAKLVRARPINGRELAAAALSRKGG